MIFHWQKYVVEIKKNDMQCVLINFLIALKPHSMVDPQWIDCIEGQSEFSSQSAEVRLAVTGEQPLFTLGLPMLALSLADFLSLVWSHSTNMDFFYYCQKYDLKDTNKILEKKSCSFKTWMVFVGQIMIDLGTSSIWGFL